MKVGILDIITFIIMFQLFAFTIFLFAKKANFSNYLLGAQLFSQFAGIFSGFCFIQFEYFYNNAPLLFLIGYPFSFLWGPTFYLYVKSAAYSDFKFKLPYLLHFIPFIIVLIFLSVTYFLLSSGVQREILSSRSHEFFKNGLFLDIFIRAQVLFYIIKSLLVLYIVKNKLKESYSSLTKTNLAWIRFLVYGFTLSYFLTIPMIIYSYFINSYNSILPVLILTPYFLYFNIIFFKAWYHPELFGSVEEYVKYKSSKLTKEEASTWIEKLDEYIRIHKPYLNPDLTLNQIAESIDISPRILSQIINEYFKQNFQDYINRLRIEESKKILLDLQNKKTVLEILYGVGFNTKSAYNVAFKKTTGFTPTEYKKRYANKQAQKL